MAHSEIVTYIFDDSVPDLAAQFARWMADSPRFKAFVETYRDKIRKKVRGIRDAEGRSDLQFELAIAYLLLRERRFTVEYEKYGVGKQRAPDFSVTFKTWMHFNVEVKRMRAVSPEPRAEELPGFTKVINTVCEKIGQLPPSVMNILALTAAGSICTGSDIALAMKLLKERADRKDDLFFVRRGFGSARDFLKQYPRLSGILFCDTSEQATAARPVLWLNAQARHPIPTELATALRR